MRRLSNIEKKCTKCSKKKSIDLFYKKSSSKSGHTSQCKECIDLHQKEYYSKNKDQRNEKVKEWCVKNRKRSNAIKQKYVQNNIEKVKKSKKEYKDRQRQNSLEYRINENISKRIGESVKDKRKRSWESLVGYSVEDLIKHLELKFDSKMTWNNYGRYGWHIDHIIPKSWFIFNSCEDHEFKKCWSLENLHPKWGKENSSKRDRYVG